MRELHGRVALVTGGSKGIGRAVAAAMVAAGMDVVVTGRDDAGAAAAADALSVAGPGRAVGVGADVRDRGAQERAVARATETFGRLDALVASAGIGRFASIERLTPEDWHETLDTNLTGVFLAVKAAVEPLVASAGTIVTIGSLAGANAFARGAAYNASKFGLVGFSHAIMLDLRERGVRVSTIMPGSVATGFGGSEPGPDDAWKIDPHDVAETVLFLLRMHPRTLPSRIEVRPSRPPSG